MKLEISNNYDLAQTVFTMLQKGQLNGPLFISGPCGAGKTYQVTQFFKSNGMKYIHCLYPNRGRSYVTSAKTTLQEAGYDPDVDFVIFDSASLLKSGKRIHRGSISEHSDHFTLGKFRIPYNKLIIIDRDSMTEDLPYVDELVFPSPDRKFLIRNHEGEAELEDLARAALLSYPNYWKLNETLEYEGDTQLQLRSLFGLNYRDLDALKGCRDFDVYNFYNTPGCHDISKPELKWMKSNLIRQRLITDGRTIQITEKGKIVLKLNDLKQSDFEQYKAIIEQRAQKVAAEIRKEGELKSNVN